MHGNAYVIKRKVMCTCILHTLEKQLAFDIMYMLITSYTVLSQYNHVDLYYRAGMNAKICVQITNTS